MTLNKGVCPERKFFCNARKARPKGGKTNPKVLLAHLPKRLSFGVRHRFSPQHPMRRYAMQWIDPDFCDLRLGFEVTAYVYVR